MAGGVSKVYEREWVYEPGGTEFKDRVGKVLSRGHNLKETFKREAAATVKRNDEMEKKEGGNRGAYDPSKANPEFYRQTEGKAQEVDTRGYVWVTPEGEEVAPASNASFRDLPPPPTPKQSLTTEKQKLVANMDESQRSMHIWKRINPGCLHVNTKLPESMATTHFAHRPEQAEPVNKEFHAQKSEFTQYADRKIQLYGTGTKW